MTVEEHKEIIKELHAFSMAISKEISDVKVQVGRVEQKQIDNHKEHKTAIEILDKKVEKFNDLPCKEHVADIKNMQEHVKEGKMYRNILISFILSSLVVCAGAGMAWGKLRQSVTEHHKTYNFALEHCCDDIE